MTHGEVDEFRLNGYSVAHKSPVKAHEKDFEGITFVVESPEGGEVTAENIRPERSSTERYLQKFAGWDEDIAQAVHNHYTNRKGVEEFRCPHNEGELCMTTVVDQIFIPNISGGFEGNMGVYDGNLEIHTILEYGSNKPKEVFSKIIEEAQDQGLKSILFSTTDVKRMEPILTELEFETTTKERTRFRDTYTELNAELELQ